MNNFDLNDSKMVELRLLVWRLTNSSSLATDLKAVAGREEPPDDPPDLEAMMINPSRRVKGGG